MIIEEVIFEDSKKAKNDSFLSEIASEYLRPSGLIKLPFDIIAGSLLLCSAGSAYISNRICPEDPDYQNQDEVERSNQPELALPFDLLACGFGIPALVISCMGDVVSYPIKKVEKGISNNLWKRIKN